MSEAERLKAEIRRAAAALGFARCGFAAPRSSPQSVAALERWLAAGHDAGMAYMRDAVAERCQISHLRPSTSTVVVVALDCPPTPGAAPMVAAYARGADYHLVLHRKLLALRERCHTLAGVALTSRITIDSAPVLERDLAMRAGIAFIGKSTMAIALGLGSYVLFGELLVDLALPPDPPVARRCGRCTLCLDACPTCAIVAPYVVDARRCISYWTIEFRGVIPRVLRPAFGAWVVGCDACQQVCPHNAGRHDGLTVPELAPRAALQTPDLIQWLDLSTGDYRRLSRGTTLKRLSRRQLARNAAVALGNLADRDALPALQQALCRHHSPLVRAHAAWAFGRLQGDVEVLRRASREDPDETVREEAAVAASASGGAAHETSSSTTTGA
ncbi:MAG: tRNA epoxyqueuosine(34) reductase QueG [Deltaproteobacteria bacterium]|nr:tRNA epoxyqueuosine(34) reductase QueG [Deltaproteobacteria bacterium]